MRYTIIGALLIIVDFSAFSQTVSDLKFDQRFTKCEKKWVVMPKADTVKYYSYGYIYMPHNEILLRYKPKGTFSINKKGEYIEDTAAHDKNQFYERHFDSTSAPVALLPVTHFKELGVQPEPEWVKQFYSYSDTAKYIWLKGRAYNRLKEYEIALAYLERPIAVSYMTRNIALEKSYSYRQLKRYDQAVQALTIAINEKPEEGQLLLELGDVYFEMKDYDNSLKTYLDVFKSFDYHKSESQGQVAYNIASIYRLQGKQHVYKIWMMKAKNFTPDYSVLYRKITEAGF